MWRRWISVQGLIVSLLIMVLWPACTIGLEGSGRIVGAEDATTPDDEDPSPYVDAVWVAGFWMWQQTGYVWIPLEPGEYPPETGSETAPALADSLRDWI